jgi:hypothetical protein
LVNSSPFQPAIPFEGNFRTRKEDRKQNHTHDHKELYEKEGQQKYVEHFSLDSQRFHGSRPVQRPEALPASRTPVLWGGQGKHRQRYWSFKRQGRRRAAHLIYRYNRLLDEDFLRMSVGRTPHGVG